MWGMGRTEDERGLYTLGQMLNLKYFPRQEFLNSNLKHASSFAWHSVWGATALINKGLHWKVGNGKNRR